MCFFSGKFVAALAVSSLCHVYKCYRTFGGVSKKLLYGHCYKLICGACIFFLRFVRYLYLCVQGAKTEMEKLKFSEMTCKEAMKQVCKM